MVEEDVLVLDVVDVVVEGGGPLVVDSQELAPDEEGLEQTVLLEGTAEETVDAVEEQIVLLEEVLARPVVEVAQGHNEGLLVLGIDHLVQHAPRARQLCGYLAPVLHCMPHELASQLCIGALPLRLASRHELALAVQGHNKERLAGIVHLHLALHHQRPPHKAILLAHHVATHVKDPLLLQVPIRLLMQLGIAHWTVLAH